MYTNSGKETEGKIRYIFEELMLKAYITLDHMLTSYSSRACNKNAVSVPMNTDGPF